jgi:hypothetical protein
VATTTREQLHTIIDELSDDRLREVRDALERLMAGDGSAADQGFMRRLRGGGLLLSEPPALSDDEHRQIHERPPLTMRGEAISDTIVRDRGGVD